MGSDTNGYLHAFEHPYRIEKTAYSSESISFLRAKTKMGTNGGVICMLAVGKTGRTWSWARYKPYNRPTLYLPPYLGNRPTPIGPLWMLHSKRPAGNKAMDDRLIVSYMNVAPFFICSGCNHLRLHWPIRLAQLSGNTIKTGFSEIRPVLIKVTLGVALKNPQPWKSCIPKR